MISASNAPFMGSKRLFMVAVLCAFSIMLPLAFTRLPIVEEAILPELQLRSNDTQPIAQLQRHNNITVPSSTLEHRDLGEYLPTKLEKHGLLGPDGIMPGKVLPSILSKLSPNVVGALTSLAAAPLSTLVPAIPNIPNILPTVLPDGGAGMPLLPDMGGLALNPAGLATIAEDAGDWMAAGISGILRGATGLIPAGIPLATVVNNVVAEASAAADQVLSKVQNAATEVAALAAQVETNLLSPDGALTDAGSLLDDLEATIDHIVDDVVSNIGNVVPAHLLDNVKSLVNGGVNSILAATNGPVALVASIIDANLCEAVKVVDGVLTTVTGVCGDMASVTSFSPTYSESRVATGTGMSSLSQTATGAGPTSASAAQSMTMPSATNSGAGQTGQPSGTGIQGNTSGGTNPTQPSTATASGNRLSQSGSLGNNSATQTASTLGSSFSGIGQSVTNSSTGPSQTTSDSAASFSGSGGQSPTTGGNGVSTGGTSAVSGEPTPLPPEGTGSKGSWTGGGNMPSPTDQPHGGPVFPTPGVTGSGISAVTISITVKSTLTITSGAVPTQTVYLPGSITAVTITTMYIPCSVQPPCPTCPPSLSSPGARTGKGPCPGLGYTCDDCVDGWFCPPPQTPAQYGPNGCFGWPCAHCSSGWFCIPTQSAGTCTSPGASGDVPNPGGSMTLAPSGQDSGTTTSPRPTGIPSNTAAPNPPDAFPTIRNQANGWSYSGCWADQPLFAVLDFTPETGFGPVENEKCVRHCIINGYTIAATSFGSTCFCGQFLNGTQKLDDSECMTPCSGDNSQACGSDWSLLTYTPDGIPRGWAPIGEQPNPNPRPVPTIVELVYGGVEQSVVTHDVVIGPTSGADIGSLISSYGERSVQPQASLPNGVGPQTQCTTLLTGPNGAGMTAPGSGKGSTLPSSGGASPTSSGGSNPNSSPSSPNGGGGVAPGQSTPTLPGGGGGPSLSFPGGQVPGTPGSNSPSPIAPSSGNPNSTPGGGNSGMVPGVIASSNPGASGGSIITQPAGGIPLTSPSAPNGSGIAPGQQTPTSPGSIGTNPNLSGGGIPSPTSEDSSPGTTPGGIGSLNPSGNPSGPSPNGGTWPTLPGNSDPNSLSSPRNGGGVAPGQQTPTSQGGIGPSPTLPSGGSPNKPSSPSGPGGNIPSTSEGLGGQGKNTLPGISAIPTPTSGVNSPSSPHAPGGQSGSISPGGNGATPIGPGGNVSGPNPSGGQLPTCAPGSSGINCIPPSPPGGAASVTPPGGLPESLEPNNSQGIVSLPGVATPTSPGISLTQSSSKQASLTAPGKQTPSSSTNGIPTIPGGDGNPSSSSTETSPITPSGLSPGIPSSPNPGVATTPSVPSGTNPGAPGQGSNPGASVPTPTPKPTRPGGIGPDTTPVSTTRPNEGSSQDQPSADPTNGSGLSSYSWPPGIVPYGNHPPFTTLAHILSWNTLDGSNGGIATEKRAGSKLAEINAVD